MRRIDVGTYFFFSQLTFYCLHFADEDGDTSEVVRSAEKRHQKVKELLRRMKSSDEEDFLCEPLTQMVAPLHVRLK